MCRILLNVVPAPRLPDVIDQAFDLLLTSIKGIADDAVPEAHMATLRLLIRGAIFPIENESAVDACILGPRFRNA